MYRRDFASVLRRQDWLAGLGLAWGRGLGVAESDIMLAATPNALGEGLDRWILALAAAAQR